MQEANISSSPAKATPKFYAHSHPDFPNDPDKWQKLEDHLKGIAEKCS